MTTPRQLIGCAASASGGLTNLTANVCPSGPGSILLLDAPGFCPLCLERYIDGRDGGAKTQLIEEVVNGVKPGNWICPCERGPEAAPDPAAGTPVVSQSFPHGGPRP